MSVTVMSGMEVGENGALTFFDELQDTAWAKYTVHFFEYRLPLQDNEPSAKHGGMDTHLILGDPSCY